MRSGDTIIVRPLATGEEIDTYCYLATETFSTPGGDVATEARHWRCGVEAAPEFAPRQWRGAFIGERFAGGYLIYERELRAGAARLRTVCIGGVVTHPDHRMRGVGAALMRDAIAFAEQYDHTLLLLDGIPNFYHRWGYADVFDLTEHVIDRAAISAIPATAASGCTTRPATLEDAPALLALYERHYAHYTGSFVRTLEHQRLRLARALDSGDPPTLAVDTAGNVVGYLLLPRDGDRDRAGEAAADTWSAAAALLQHHTRMLEASANANPPNTLAWPLPLDSHTYYLLADHLDFPSASQEIATRTAVIRGETYVARRAAWMARPVSLRRVIEALLPAWRDCLTRARVTTADAFTLRMSDETCALRIMDGVVQLLPAPAPGTPEATITPEQLVQLVFGYRPVRYLAIQPGAAIPDHLLPLLDTLFPTGQPWIPWSDGF